MANWNAYENARKRTFPPMGRKAVTDADVIIAQEEEIERYRAKIRDLEEILHAAVYEPLKFGDVCTINVNDHIIKFALYEVTQTAKEDARPEICIKGIVCATE